MVVRILSQREIEFVTPSGSLLIQFKSPKTEEHFHRMLPNCLVTRLFPH
jgi:hypothetical protein